MTDEQMIDVETGEIVAVASAEEARKLTDRIRESAATYWTDIAVAYKAHAWLSLGYGTWDEYCTGEFDDIAVPLPKEGLPAVVRSLRESGLSVRAISSVTGQSKSAVSRQVSQSGTPAQVQGSDGKQYPPTPSPAVLAARARRAAEAEAAAKSAGGDTPPPGEPSTAHDAPAPPAEPVELDIDPAILARLRLSKAIVKVIDLLDINPAEVGSYLLTEDRTAHLRFCDELTAWASLSRESLSTRLRSVQ